MSRHAIVMGKGTLAIRIAEWFSCADGFQLRCLVPVVPEPEWTDSLIGWARLNDIPHVESGEYRDIPELADEGWRPSLVISVFYDKIIDETFIGRCDRILNLHNSPLPKYRGVSPINWALKNGERRHGVTIHEITPGIDDGPIVAKLEYSIYPELDEVIDVYRRALAYGWTLFEETMPILDQIRPQPQDEAEATYFSRVDDDLLGERRGFRREASGASGRRPELEGLPELTH